MIRRALRIRPWIAVLWILVAGIIMIPTTGLADNVQAVTDLRKGQDFRIRVAAALKLGKTGNAAYAPPLEDALADDHPAVRAAAAAALGKIGAPSSEKALRKALARESHDTVRGQIESTLSKLKPQAIAPKYVVQFGKMKNTSANKGAHVGKAFRKTSIASIKSVPGALVMGEKDDALKESQKRSLPLFVLDATLTKLDESKDGSDVLVAASVEYVIREVPGQSLRGSVRGAAEARANAQSATSVSMKEQLQTDAIGAAVERAMKSAGVALDAAAD